MNDDKKMAAKKDFPLAAEEQQVLSMTVPCSFCKVPVGHRCVPGLIFPQYPHTPRLQDALVDKGHDREVVLSLYNFGDSK